MRLRRPSPAFSLVLVSLLGCSHAGTGTSGDNGDDASGGSGSGDASMAPAPDAGAASGDGNARPEAGSSGGDSASSADGPGPVGDAAHGDAAMAAADSGGGGNDGGSGCASLPLCEDFESYAAGGAPGASLWTLIGTKGCGGTGNPSAPTVYPIVVDTAQSHSGTKSAKVSGGDSCGPVMLHTAAFSKLTTGEVYGLFFVRLSDTTTTFDHAALMALGLTADAGNGLNVMDQTSYLQLASEGAGNATNVFMWQTSDGNILPAKNAMGGMQSTYATANAWTCVEFHTSANTGAIETWVNGTSVAGLTFVPGTTQKVPSVNDQWKAPSPFSPTSLGFGWVLFSGPMMTVWIDDVALAGSRIGCQ